MGAERIKFGARFFASKYCEWLFSRDLSDLISNKAFIGKILLFC